MADAGFRDYEREFQRLTDNIPKRLESVTQFENDAEAQNAEIRRIESDITQAKQMVNSMQLEVRTMAEPLRSNLGNIIRTYQTSLTSLSADATRAKGAISRKALLGSVTSPRDQDLNLGASRSQREKMMEATEKMSAGTTKLQQALVVLGETEEVAVDITTELDRNRQTLLSAREKIGHVSGVTDTARRVLASMGRREVRIKIMMAVFILLIIIVISVVAYYISKGKK